MKSFHKRIAAAVSTSGMLAAGLARDYESYYLYIGGFPQQETEWSEDVQGVAHDDDNWFISNTQFIWKIGVGVDLRTADLGQAGVSQTSFGLIPELGGYDHFGDPDVYRHRHGNSHTDYLLVPIENGDATCGSGLQGAIVVLRTDDLSYVDHVVLPGQCNDAGWVAARKSDGRLFSSRQHVGQPGPPTNPPDPSRQGGLREYALDWERLHTTRQAVVTFVQEHPLSNEFNCMQGGEFAPGEELLYLVSGFHDDSNELADREGIHVLETATWTRVAHSTRGFGHFDYYYNPGHTTYEEPEGLTIWDLDDGRAPGIRGQLHVFVLDNDDPEVCPFCDQDDIDFKHYTNVIRVNSGSSCETDTAACPFRTVSAALNLAWDGAEIRMRTATYAETPTISRRVRLSAEGGPVRIGN